MHIVVDVDISSIKQAVNSDREKIGNSRRKLAYVPRSSIFSDQIQYIPVLIKELVGIQRLLAASCDTCADHRYFCYHFLLVNKKNKPYLLGLS